jgi:hypothetical protein
MTFIRYAQGQIILKVMVGRKPKGWSNSDKVTHACGILSFVGCNGGSAETFVKRNSQI